MLPLLHLAMFFGWMAAFSYHQNKPSPSVFGFLWALTGMTILGFSAVVHLETLPPIDSTLGIVCRATTLVSLSQLLILTVINSMPEPKLHVEYWNEHKATLKAALDQRHFSYKTPNGTLFVHKLWPSLPIRRILFISNEGPCITTDAVRLTSRSATKILTKILQDSLNQEVAPLIKAHEAQKKAHDQRNSPRPHDLRRTLEG